MLVLGDYKGNLKVGMADVKKSVDNLNEQCWHDSVLHEIKFIRTGSADRVIFILDMLNSWEDQLSQRTEVIFGGCRLVRTEMNWGVKCMSDGEMVYGATCSLDGNLVDEVRSTWKGFKVPELAQFQMELSSTGSSIELVFESSTIIARGVRGPHSAPPPIRAAER